MADRHVYTNRLIKEKSLYLLQHAHNPVDWYAWGEEAFEAALEQNRPIFLSIGYSTCHWCHVMEKESFENLRVAELMNETFINIKIDREELPEVDGLYMEFAQSMMSGAAGWPLNIILTPQLRPFFAATYLPIQTSHGLMGLIDLIQRIKAVWESDEREKVIAQSEKIVEVFTESVHTTGEEIPEKETIGETADLLFKMTDSIFGGMRGAPKFPIGYQYNMLMRYSFLYNDSRAIFVVEKTLEMMQRGGIYDHLGGGFSRYSVDERWLVPHFEKMLYDNALLALCYLEGWLMTRRPLYQKVCRSILNYVLRDMTHSSGGFYSAEDADSEGHEGLFYTWPYEEIKQVLGDDHSRFCDFYNITPPGNFEGRNILNTPLSLEEFAAESGFDVNELDTLFTEQRGQLWKVREQRIHPLKDDKVLSSWNGLMIAALTETGLAFNEHHYVDAAEMAARFINSRLTQDGYLLRRWREGEALHRAGLEEYAFMIKAYLGLFEAGRGSRWLECAIEFAKILKEKFKASDGAFYQTDGEDPHLILRKCQFSDGAEPSGNAVHCENLLKLYSITGNDDYLEAAEDVFKGVEEYINNYAPGYCYHLMNLIRYYDLNAPLMVIALNKDREYAEELSVYIFNRYLPHKTVVWISGDDAIISTYAPALVVQTPKNDRTTLYICYHGVCKEPVTGLEAMQKAIASL